jgi:hypothetical protein
MEVSKMKRSGLVTGLIVVLLCWVPVTASANKVDAKELEKSLDRALKAYNDADHVKFWAEYTSMANDLKTKKNFDDFRGSLYKQYGEFVKRGDLVKDKSNLEGEMGPAQWKAEFEKDKKVIIAVSWIKEGNAIKFAQIEIGPPQE